MESIFEEVKAIREVNKHVTKHTSILSVMTSLLQRKREKREPLSLIRQVWRISMFRNLIVTNEKTGFPKTIAGYD